MFSMRYKQIGAKIIYYRVLKDMSQEQLAERAGISPSYLSKIEHGKYEKNLPFTTILLIAKALEVDVCEIIKVDE